jgi:hypothetical protein
MYVKFSRPKRFTGARHALGLGEEGCCHIEAARGSDTHNRDYCTKEESRIMGPWEIGTIGGQGTRSDLDGLKKTLDETGSEREAWESHFGAMMKYHKGAQRYLLMKMKQRSERTKMIVVVGPTGVGKTTLISTTYPQAYWKPFGPMESGKWWPQYSQEEVTVFDEFTGQMPFNQWKRLGDSTPMQVEQKGCHVHFNSKLIVMISNVDPFCWWDWTKHGEDGWRQMQRRVDEWWWYPSQEIGAVKCNSYEEFKNMQRI